MGCGASAEAAALVVDIEERPAGDPAHDELVSGSPTLSNAFEKRMAFEQMMKDAMHRLGSAFDLWKEHTHYQHVIKQVRGRFMHLNMAAAFHGWNAKVQDSLEKKRKEANALRMLRRLLNRELAACIDAWITYVEMEQTVKACRAAVYLAADRAVDDAEDARLERMGKAERATVMQAELEDRSARYIQARYRGRLTRAEMREQHKAASKIASRLKGRKTRRALKERKPGRGILRQPNTMNLAALGSEAQKAQEADEAQEAAHKLTEEKAARLAASLLVENETESQANAANALAGAAKAAAAERMLAASQHGAQSAMLVAAARAAADSAMGLEKAAAAEQARLHAEKERLHAEEVKAEEAAVAAQKALDEAKEAMDFQALAVAEEAQRVADEAKKAAHEAEQRAKEAEECARAEAERLHAEAEAARLAEEAEAEKARLQAEADERERAEAEAEAERLEAEAEAKRKAAAAAAEAQKIADEEARVAAEAECGARAAAAMQSRRLRIKEDAQRTQMYFGGKGVELVSRRMPGTVRDSGVCRDSKGAPERFADKDLYGFWTGAGLSKRIDLMKALPLVPVIDEEGTMDDEQLAKALKRAGSKRKKTYNGIRWIAVMLSEAGKPMVPLKKGDLGEPDIPSVPATAGAQVSPTPDFNDFVPGQKAQSLPPVPAVTACLEAGLVPAVLALLAPGIDYGPEFPPEMWQLVAMWVLVNLCGTPEDLGLSADDRADRRERGVSEGGPAGVLVECGALPVLVRHIDMEQQPSANVREHAIWALGQIVAVSIPCRDAVLDAGALAPILAHFYGVARRISSSSALGEGEGWPGPMEGVLSHGESIEIQHWGRRTTTTLALLCTTRDEELTDQCLPVWAYLVEEEDERILKFALSVLLMLSEGSLKRLKSVVDTRSPAKIYTLQQRQNLQEQDKRKQERRRDKHADDLYDAMAASPIARAQRGGERERRGVVDRLVELMDSGGSIKVQALQVIDNVCVANSYVCTTQDRFVEEVQTSGVGAGNALKKLLQQMLSVDQTTAVLAVRVLVNMLAGTQAQIGRVLDLDCTCAAVPVGHVFPILLRWLVGSAKAKSFQGISLHGDRSIGQTVVELTEAAQAICNASWSKADHVQHLLRQGCLDGLLTLLARIHPLHGLAHHELADTALENHEDIQDLDGVIIMPAMEAIGNFMMWELGSDEKNKAAVKTEREEDKAFDTGTKLPPGWKKAEDAMGEVIYLNDSTGQSGYEFPRETEDQRMARRTKRKVDHLARTPKKGRSSNDVGSQRDRLLLAGFDEITIDNMIHAKKMESGSHLGVKDHILEHGRRWAEDMGVLEQPTMTELMNRTSVTLGTGTELLQSYLVHKNPAVVEAVSKFLHDHFQWSNFELAEEHTHQSALALKISLEMKRAADEAAGIDTTPAVAAGHDHTPKKHELIKRAAQSYDMLRQPSDSPQYQQMVALLEDKFEPFDPLKVRSLT